MTEQSSHPDVATTPTDAVGHAPPRLDGETHAAYKAFKAYIRMGPDRSQDRVAELLGHSSRRHVSRWSSDNRWVERVAEYEDALDRERWEDAEAVVRQYRRQLAEARGQVAADALEVLTDVGIQTLRQIITSSSMDTAKIGGLKLLLELVGYAPPPPDDGSAGGITSEALVEALTTLGVSPEVLALVVKDISAAQDDG